MGSNVVNDVARPDDMTINSETHIYNVVNEVAYMVGGID
jgi:hypothetical protein